MSKDDGKKNPKDQGENTNPGEQKAKDSPKDLKEIIAEFAQKNRTLFCICLAFSIWFYHGMFDWSTNFGAMVKSSSETLFVVQVFLTAFTMSRILVFINIIDIILRMPVVCDLIFWLSWKYRAGNFYSHWKDFVRIFYDFEYRKASKEFNQQHIKFHANLGIIIPKFKFLLRDLSRYNVDIMSHLENIIRNEENKKLPLFMYDRNKWLEKWGNYEYIFPDEDNRVVGFTNPKEIRYFFYKTLEKPEVHYPYLSNVPYHIRRLAVRELKGFFYEKTLLFKIIKTKKYRQAIGFTIGFTFTLANYALSIALIYFVIYFVYKWLSPTPIPVTTPEQLFFSYVNKHFL